MLTHRGFSAWIVSGGRELPEYLVAVDEAKHRVQCWVPSEEGKTFTVYWRDHGSKVDTCSFVTLDGFVVPGRFLFGTGVGSRQGVRTGLSTERPFTFARLGSAESAALGDPKAAGMITLRIKRIERTGDMRRQDELPNIPEGPRGRNPDELHIAYGQEAPTSLRQPNTFAFKRLDGGHSYVTFVFRYRSREFLLAQGITTEEEPPAPTPLRPPVRRTSSAPPIPIPSTETKTLMTPSPSPSPNNKLNLKTLPVKFHPYKNLGRARKPGGPHAPRVVSLRTYTPSRPGQLPGQATMRFDNPTPPSSQTGEHLPGEGETPTDEYMDQEEDERDPKDRDVG